MRNIEDF